jgi:hypothetical protein
MTARPQTDAAADVVRILQVPAPTMHATGPAFEQRHSRPNSESSSA